MTGVQTCALPISEGCNEDLMFFFFFSILFILDTLYLVQGSCDHLMYVFHLPLHVLFLFYPYTHVSYCLNAIYYFCFTLRCINEFCLKCFRNTGCQSLLAINSFLQNFSRVCVRIDFIVFNKWVWVKWFMTSLICSFVWCGFVIDCQRRRLLGHMCFTC